MGTGKIWVSSGLVYLRKRDIDIVEAGNIVSTALETLEHSVTRIRITSDSSAQIKTRHHQVRVAVIVDQMIDALGISAKVVLSLHIVRRSDAPQQTDVNSDTVLAHLLCGLNEAYFADHVIWAGTEVVLSGREFIPISASLEDADHVFDSPIIMPRVQVNDKRPALEQQQIEDCSARLDRQLQQSAIWVQHDAKQTILCDALNEPNEPAANSVPQDLREPNAVLRLSAWFMSMAVTLLCLPVGVMLIVINLLRGENLRLANQAAALTGTFIALQSFGSMAQAATVLHNLLP